MKNRADERLDQLFAAARAERIDIDALEAHFETRLLARISELRSEPTPWYAFAWKMVPIFAVVAVIISATSFTLAPSHSSDVFAALSGDQDEVAASSYLIGE